MATESSESQLRLITTRYAGG